MYFISLPLLDLTEQLFFNYTERFDMIKKSILFQLCTKNNILGYLIFLLDLTWFSIYIQYCYEASFKYVDVLTYCFRNILGAVIFFLLSLTFYCCFDHEDYMSRMRAAEVLTDETVERMENILANEEVDISEEMSVPTDHLTRKQTEF